MSRALAFLLRAVGAVTVSCHGAPAVLDAPPSDAPGSPAMLTLDMAMVPFGSVSAGATSPATTLTITNVGEQPTGTLSVVLSGSDAASFATTGTSCTAVLAPGASCIIPATFAPQSPGAKAGTLTISSNPGGNVTALLDGVGLGVGPGMLAITTDANMLGSVVVGGFGQTAATFTVTNIGGDTTRALALQPSGANPADFIIDDRCSTHALTPNGSCTFGVRLAPKSRGERTASIEVSARPGGMVAGAVSGLGLAPAALSTAFNHRDFGTVASGSSTTATLTFANVGDVATSAITATFIGGSDFVPGGGTCIDASVAPGATCTILVTLSSNTLGPHDSSVTVSAIPDGGGHLVVTLGGVVTAATQLSIDPSAVELPPTQLGTSGAMQMFTVTNHGLGSSGPLVASNTNAASFPVTLDGCTNHTLAPNATCTITVIFTPAAATPLAATLDIVSVSSGSASASLNGVGIADATLVLASTSQGFGSVAIGATSDASLTLTNLGGRVSGIPTLAIAGANAAAFTTASTCTTPLAPGAACTITTRFTPASATAATALLVANATPGGNSNASLAGTGIAAGGLVISPSQFTFAAIAPDATSSPQSFTVRNTGTTDIADLTVTGATGFVAASAVGSLCGATLAAGTSCVIDVTFEPAIAAPATGSITAAGGGTTAFAAVAGTGLPLFEVVAIDSVPGTASGYDFGMQSVGTSQDLFVTLVAHASLAPLLRVIEQYGTPAQFQTIGNDCASDLTVGQPCTVQLRFAPTTTGAKTGTATFRAMEFSDGSGERIDLPFALIGAGAP